MIVAEGMNATEERWRRKPEEGRTGKPPIGKDSKTAQKVTVRQHHNSAQVGSALMVSIPAHRGWLWLFQGRRGPQTATTLS